MVSELRSSAQPATWALAEEALGLVAQLYGGALDRILEILVDADLVDYEKEHSARHPGILREGGHLGLQSHDNRTEFKNIFVKTLD